MLNSLSGRFLILTVLFVMLAEVLILVPSISRFRVITLDGVLERAQIAALARLASDDIGPELEEELLENAGVYNVVLRRDAMRQLVLSSPMPHPINATYDLREDAPLVQVRDAFASLTSPPEAVIRVIGAPAREAGLLIEVTLRAAPLRRAMIDYGLRVLLLSAVISMVTALLLFLAVRRVLVRPIKGLVGHVKAYAEAPEDARRIIAPRAGIRELREAEEALSDMQTQLTQALRQKERLAALGGAVARVSHDLRNILTSTQLFADRIEESEDPMVRRIVPKLVGSVTRAVTLAESTLAFGRAEEAPPALRRINLADLVSDVIENERFAVGEAQISFAEDVPATMQVRADPEQLYRALSNLVRNARQAVQAHGASGEIGVTAREDDECWTIAVRDTGPGLPLKSQEHLFQPFQGGTRKGGSGLGLAISAELVRGHGGRLQLLETGPSGTCFEITLPKGEM